MFLQYYYNNLVVPFNVFSLWNSRNSQMNTFLTYNTLLCFNKNMQFMYRPKVQYKPPLLWFLSTLYIFFAVYATTYDSIFF